MYVMSFLLSVQESSKTTATVTEKSTTGSIPLWSRSVGSMKCQLSGLVRPKTTAHTSVTSSADHSSAQESVTQNSPDGELNISSNCENSGPNSSEQCAAGSSNTVSAGLAGLGAYSSSSSSDNDEEAS